MNFLAACLSLAVLDASTIKCGVEQVLIFGIDCPALHTPEGSKARATLEALLDRQQVQLKHRTRDGESRALAKVFVNGRDVAYLMVREGICRASDGYGEYEECRPIPGPR